MSSKWLDHGMEERVLAILREVPEERPHHFGRPFLTAYQVAIVFAQRHPEIVDALDKPIGGVGTGTSDSLAQYIANELSRRIAGGSLPGVEGAFLSNRQLRDVRFAAGDREIQSSATGSSEPLSMFRLRVVPATV